MAQICTPEGLYVHFLVAREMAVIPAVVFR